MPKIPKILLASILSVGFLIVAIFIGVMATSPQYTSENTSPSTSPQALESLPYATWVTREEDVNKTGVTLFHPKRVFEGINIYSPANLSTAYVIDMSGNVLHTWSAKTDDDDVWYYVQPCANGDLLAIVAYKMFLRLDWDSNIKWKVNMRFHHDIDIGSDGDIYTLTRADEIIPQIDPNNYVRNDYLVILSNNGKVKKQISGVSPFFKGQRGSSVMIAASGDPSAEIAS